MFSRCFVVLCHCCKSFLFQCFVLWLLFSAGLPILRTSERKKNKFLNLIGIGLFACLWNAVTACKAFKCSYHERHTSLSCLSPKSWYRLISLCLSQMPTFQRLRSTCGGIMGQSACIPIMPCRAWLEALSSLSSELFASFRMPCHHREHIASMGIACGLVSRWVSVFKVRQSCPMRLCHVLKRHMIRNKMLRMPLARWAWTIRNAIRQRACALPSRYALLSW